MVTVLYSRSLTALPPTRGIDDQRLSIAEKLLGGASRTSNLWAFDLIFSGCDDRVVSLLSVFFRQIFAIHFMSTWPIHLVSTERELHLSVHASGSLYGESFC